MYFQSLVKLDDKGAQSHIHYSAILKQNSFKLGLRPGVIAEVRWQS